MKSTIGIYDSHEEALEAVKALKKAGYPVNQLSIVGKAELVEDHLHVKSNAPLKMAGISIGMVIGPILGVLTGVGVFAIPGFGFLYGVGGLIGAIAGLDLGVLGGGIISILTMLGVKEDEVVTYQEHLNKGHFMVIARGELDEISSAREVLHTHGQHIALAHH